MADFVPPSPPAVQNEDFEPNVRTSAQGDGYTIRAAAGLNAANVTRVTLSWPVLPNSQAQTILDYFKARGGVESFTYAVPPDTTEYKWICPRWRRAVVADAPLVSSVSADLERVFDL